MKPEGYPLPWCEALDMPYWKINLWLCRKRDDWREWQARRPMSEIIPIIDKEVVKNEARQQP